MVRREPTVVSVRRDLGEPIRVKARIASVVYDRSSNGRPTFINLGRAYPSSKRVTVVIWGEDRPNFPRAPERMFRRGMTICVQGVATQYRGVPQIEVALWDPRDRLLSF
jgi:DNA/RNA endonuclease YhcR with UshA esterase domain